MAIKKRGNDVKAKVEETKRKKKSREEDDDEDDEEEDDEDSDDDEEEEEEEDEEDEDDEKPVKKKGKKEEKKKGKKKKDDDDEDEEDQDDDDVYTGAYVKKMMKDPNSIPPGNYEFEIKKVRLVKGTKEKPWGGYFINVKVIEAPEDVDVPEDGWPTNLEIRFMTHIHKSMLKKDEKNKGSLRLNKSNFSRLLAAALGEIDDDETYDIKSLKGCTFGAEVVHSDKGYQNFRNFHAVEG